MGELRVLEISSRQELADRLFGVKSADVAWDKDGFFYSHCLTVDKKRQAFNRDWQAKTLLSSPGDCSGLRQADL